MKNVFSRSLFWKLFIPIGVLLVLCGIATAILLPSMIQRNAEQDAVAAGQDTVKQFKTLRKYYTENVIAKVAGKGGIKPASDHRNNPDAVPLPATMIHDLSALFKDAGIALKLYSPFPFPNRKDRVVDKFGEDAWAFLSANPDQTFYRTEALDGRNVVRVAMADRMVSQACVSCHNTFAGSPKTDWKLGDVRGVLEVDSDKQIASGARITSRIFWALAMLMIVLAVFLRIVYQRSIARPLRQAVGVAERIATGDLTGRIAAVTRDEAGQLLGALKTMQQNLADPMRQIRDAAGSIAATSNRIAAGNTSLSDRTEQQASSLEETASSMEELTSTVKLNAENARQANQLAASASDVALKGGQVVSQVVDTMDAINASARKIVDIISVIDGIAFQTNILALNAAVEAARAGEQGRGFAVVAAEVRGLAQCSAAAAKEIKTLIGDSVDRVDAGSQLVAQAGATMKEIVVSVQRVTDIMNEISAASLEQSAGIEQVNRAIAWMDESTRQNVALEEEAATAAASLHHQAEKLTQMVNVFTLDDAVVEQAASHLSPTIAPLRPSKSDRMPAVFHPGRRAAQ